MLTFLLQSYDLYPCTHRYSEILELYRMPAQLDITPISGYIIYTIANREGYIDLQSVQDNEEESDEVFTVRLLAAKGGATLSLTDNLASVTGNILFI